MSGVGVAVATTEALRWHSLLPLATSPRLYKWRQENPRPDSPALLLGRLVHCAVLEPERFARGFAPQPDFGDGRTRAGREARAEWAEGLLEGVEAIPPDLYALAMRCAQAVQAHPAVEPFLLGPAEAEVSWELNGVLCAGRIDVLGPRGIVDLKSTRQDTLTAIGRDFARYLYHGQLAWYHDGAIKAGAIPRDAGPPHVIAVQTVEPFDVAVLRMSDDTLRAGRVVYERLLEVWIGCREANWWPGIAPGVVPWDLPPWAEGNGVTVLTTEDEW